MLLQTKTAFLGTITGKKHPDGKPPGVEVKRIIYFEGCAAYPAIFGEQEASFEMKRNA